MDASFFSKPLSQLECRDNKKSCHLLEKKGTHPMRMHDNNTTYNRSNQNAGFLDTTNTTCNRSNQNTRLPDTHSCSTNQHPATPDTTKNHVLPKRGTMLKSIPCSIFFHNIVSLEGKHTVVDPSDRNVMGIAILCVTFSRRKWFLLDKIIA